MGSGNSREETKVRAKTLSQLIGSYHLRVVILQGSNLVILCFWHLPSYHGTVHQVCARENLIRQNAQARLRMVLAYLFAQLMLGQGGYCYLSLLMWMKLQEGT